MFQIHWLLVCFFILCIQNSSKGTPLTGEKVRKAEDREFPFVVSLSWKYPTRYKYLERNHFCGGALITPKHILTAAHCLKKVDGPDDFVVKVNNRDLRDSKSYKVKKWITYDGWANIQTTNETLNDITILVLSGFVGTTKPAVLTNTPEAELYGKKSVIAGWGLTDNNERPQFLLTAELDVLEPQNCLINSQNEVTSDENITSHMFMCTSANPLVYTQCSDSGSPVFIKPDEIIAVHQGHCEAIKNGQPIQRQNLHLSVNHYREFITDVAKCEEDKGGCYIL